MNSCSSASSDQVSGRAAESLSSSFLVITPAEGPLLSERAEPAQSLREAGPED